MSRNPIPPALPGFPFVIPPGAVIPGTLASLARTFTGHCQKGDMLAAHNALMDLNIAVQEYALYHYTAVHDRAITADPSFLPAILPADKDSQS